MSTVLFVDDNETDLMLFKEGLAARGLTCITEPDPEKAIQKIIEHNPDVVLLDVEMPKMNGFEVCARIKANPLMADIPVIFISGTQDKNKITTAMHIGCVDFLSKPAAMDVVAHVLKSHELIGKMQQSLSPIREKLAEFKDKYGE